MQIRRVVAMLAAAVLLQVTAAGCGLFGARAGQAVPAASPGAGTTATAPTPATVASATYGAGETLGALMVAHAITPVVVAMPAAAAPVKLAAVQFLTTHIGWAVGSRCTTASVCQGLILSTRDGGATWPAPVVLPAALTGLQFLDTQNGWAFGPSALYATKDGGATWTSVPLPADAGRVAAVQASFADAADGWLILHLQACATQGCGVRLYATSDGGATWRLLASNEPPGGGSTGLGWSEFVAGGDIGGGHGWMLAQTPAGIMQTTADSGRTWQGQALSSGGSPVGGGFAANGTGWVAASRGTGAPTVRVWESADSGTAWRSITTVSGRVAGLFAAMDGATAWLMLQPASATACPAYPCGASVSVVSAMGTATAPAPLAGWTLLNISALDATTAWAVAAGTGGYALLATTDGGKTWRPLYQAAKAATLGRLWGFVDSGHGWALGSATDPTAMLKTADGGATWTPAGRVPVTQPLAAGFSDLLHGWVADLQGAYVTADGGATWTKITVPAAAIAAMGFTTPKDGWLLPEATKSQPAVAL
ncbi:MAG TPA: YCF48-related protein, partial [Bacillota bacterium]|nr:YCF48-related protein [Bacillota bacterium]